jgi:hypothetical protein
MTSGLLVVMFGAAVVIGNSDATDNDANNQNLVAQFIAASGGGEFGYQTAQADQKPAKAPLMSAQAATAEQNATVAEHSFDEEKLVMVSFSTKAVPPKAEAPEAEVIKAAAVAEAPVELLTVTGSRVNLRAGPSTGNPVIGKLMEGEQVELIGYDSKGWAQIRVEGEKVGYMSANFLKPSA